MTTVNNLPSVRLPAQTGLNPSYVGEVQALLRQWPTMLEEVNVPGFTVEATVARVHHWYMDFVVNFDCVGRGADLRRSLIYKVAEVIDPHYMKTGTTNVYLRTPLGMDVVFNRIACVTKARDKLTVGRVGESVFAIDDVKVYIHPEQR